MKTLKDWIVVYRENKEVMNEFITYETVREMNEQGQYDEVRYIRTQDKALNQIMKRIEAKYCYRKENAIDKKDINEYFLNALYEVFEKADIKRSPSEIISWAGDKMNFVVIEHIRTQYDIEIVSENETAYNTENEDEVNISDVQIYRDWLKSENVNTYEKFLEFVGGLEAILSEKQYEIYTYMKSNMTQQEVAEKMGVSQQYVSKTLQSAVKRIRAEYLSFRTYRIMMKSNTYQKVKTFVKYTENILEHVTDDEAMLYTYMMNFLRENDEDDISFEVAHANQKDDSTSVLDALFDYMSENDMKWFMLYLKGEKEATTKKEKEKFVRIVNKSFTQYLIAAEKVLKKASETIVEREIHEKVIDIIA
jgi:RNA polymerase sigma factor (sigma-70 family)